MDTKQILGIIDQITNIFLQLPKEMVGDQNELKDCFLNYDCKRLGALIVAKKEYDFIHIMTFNDLFDTKYSVEEMQYYVKEQKVLEKEFCSTLPITIKKLLKIDQMTGIEITNALIRLMKLVGAIFYINDENSMLENGNIRIDDSVIKCASFFDYIQLCLDTAGISSNRWDSISVKFPSLDTINETIANNITTEN